jgi:hypothetical protein
LPSDACQPPYLPNFSDTDKYEAGGFWNQLFTVADLSDFDKSGQRDCRAKGPRAAAGRFHY